jgi:hypothetical protein
MGDGRHTQEQPAGDDGEGFAIFAGIGVAVLGFFIFGPFSLPLGYGAYLLILKLTGESVTTGEVPRDGRPHAQPGAPASARKQSSSAAASRPAPPLGDRRAQLWARSYEDGAANAEAIPHAVTEGGGIVVAEVSDWMVRRFIPSVLRDHDAAGEDRADLDTLAAHFVGLAPLTSVDAAIEAHCCLRAAVTCVKDLGRVEETVTLATFVVIPKVHRPTCGYSIRSSGYVKGWRSWTRPFADTSRVRKTTAAQ